MAEWKKKDYAERAAKHGYEIKYGKTPKDLLKKCDGCGEAFSVAHVHLDVKKVDSF